MGNFLENIWGSIPKVAAYTPTEFGTEQLKAIKNNISAFPEIEKLGSLFQDYMTSAYEKAIPGFSKLLEGGGRLTQAMIDQAGGLLQGKVPADVLAAVQRSSAYQSLTGGYLGSAMQGANAARNIGLTSLDMIKQGAALAGEAGNAAQRWMGLASNLVMSPSGMLVTPQQQAALTMQNNLYKQATQQRKFNLDAMPDPATRGIHDTVINLIGAYLGKGMSGSTAPKQIDWSGQTFGEGSDVSQAFGPSMESLFAGSSDFKTGGPIDYGGTEVNIALPEGGASNPFNPSISGYTTGYKNPFGY